MASTPGPPKSSFLRKAKIAAGIGTVAVFAFHAAPHVFPQLNRKLFETVPKQEAPHTHRLILADACKRIGIKNVDGIDLFYNSGFGTISAGSLDLPNKAVIGLPRSFLLNDIEELKKAGVKFQDTAVHWDSKCGKALEKALIPKDDHIAFAMAHELAHIKNNDVLYRSLFPTAWFFATCQFMFFAVPRARGAPTTGYKALLVVLLVILSSYFYYESSKYLRCLLESKADEAAAGCGSDYCSGGISYLRSHLRVNRVIRHLTSFKGLMRYSEEGNDLHDAYHPLLTDRIQKLKEIQKKYS